MPGTHWSAEEEETLRRLWADGLHHYSIADAVGRSDKAVRNKAKALGLPRRHGARKPRKYPWMGIMAVGAAHVFKREPRVDTVDLQAQRYRGAASRYPDRQFRITVDGDWLWVKRVG